MSAPLGIYVHWPFCAAKCPYCDFNSHVRHGGVDQARFARAFVTELNHAAQSMGGRTVDSVFFGGGTPSLMVPDTVETILAKIETCFTLSANCEITLEANPTSVEQDRFKAFRECGINRVSLGVQALNNGDLKALGRLHSASEALAAITIANRHFDRVSFDLIYARSGQTVDAWRTELSQAMALQPTHLSLYQLTIEPGTPFFERQKTGRLTIPDMETGAALYDLTQDMCETAGLPAYEVSNHAVPGQESRHNLIYWQSGDFIGIGPGAYGRFWSGDKRVETTRIAKPEDWLAAVETHHHGLSALRQTSLVEAADEMLMMGLRLADGLELNRYETLAGQALDRQKLTDFQDAGFLSRTEGRLQATRAGRRVLNRLIVELSP